MGNLKFPWPLLAMIALSLPSLAPAVEHGQNYCILATEETVGTLAIIDRRGHVIRRLMLGERPHEVEVSPDGKTAYVTLFGITDYDSRIGTPGTVVAGIDLIRGVRIADYPLPSDIRAPHGVKLRPAKFQELFVNAEVGGDSMVVFDRDSHRVLRRFPLPSGAHNFVFSRDGTALFVFAGTHGVIKIDPDTGSILAAREYGSPIRGLAIAVDGAVLASARDAVLELQPSDLTEIRRLPVPGGGQFAYLAQLDDGTIMAPSINNGGVAIFATDGEPVRFIATGKTPIHLAIAGDGKIFVANVDDSHISVLRKSGSLSLSANPPIEKVTSPNSLNFGACPQP